MCGHYHNLYEMTTAHRSCKSQRIKVLFMRVEDKGVLYESRNVLIILY